MSIFDHFVSRATGEQERKTFSPTPYRKLMSKLEASAEDAKARCPEDSQTVDDFVEALRQECKKRGQKPPEGGPQPVKAQARFFLSEDRMSAYACLLAPENNGEGIALEAFLEDMRYEGITYGVLEEDIQREFGHGYFQVFPVARGKLPQAGEDGKVVELFQRRDNMSLEVNNEGQVDFTQDIQLQPIRKGAVICLIRPPRPGTDGMNVTGQVLPCPKAEAADVPQGENTTIGRGGQALTADVDGILYIENGRFCIHEQKIMDGDVDQFQGRLQISGNLYIEGNVDGGVEIEATGDVVVNGKVGQAKITSGGTIRAQQGVYGVQGKTLLSAAHQVQAPAIEWAEIGAGTNVVAEMISNSSIRCEGTVYATGGRGMITGSVIRAGGSVLCQRIGNLAGERSQFSVGYPPHSPESWNRLKGELDEVQATVKKLWATISELRKKGFRITEMEKSVLERLVEQRGLYIEKRDALTAEMNALEKVLGKKSRGKVQCEKLYPALEVQIGRLTKEITTAEENCNIHMDDGKIYMR